jgi:hypothetical protein
MRTEVRFESDAFNTTEAKPYFINDCCFGDDVCRWLIGELRGRGVETAAEPGQEDFGWYFTFEAGGAEHCLVLVLQPADGDDPARWIGEIERSAGFISSILGGRRRGISPAALQAIHDVLSSSPAIRNVSWHEAGAPAPP